MNDEDLQAQQREVQRLLGRCMLHPQQYERLMKGIVAHHDISGPAYELDGDKCCISFACSSCATVTWMGSEPPAIGFAPSSSTWVSPSTRNSGVVNNLPRWARSGV